MFVGWQQFTRPCQVFYSLVTFSLFRTRLQTKQHCLITQVIVVVLVNSNFFPMMYCNATIKLWGIARSQMQAGSWMQPRSRIQAQFRLQARYIRHPYFMQSYHNTYRLNLAGLVDTSCTDRSNGLFYLKCTVWLPFHFQSIHVHVCTVKIYYGKISVSCMCLLYNTLCLKKFTLFIFAIT